MIIKKGQANAVIVKPNRASKQIEFATLELQKYLEKITGASLQIVTDCEKITGEKIIVGSPNVNVCASEYISVKEFNELCPGKEGIFIKSYNGALIVAGSLGDLDRGTVYAVYELLESYCGCSFGAFTNPAIAGGEFVPLLDSLELNDINYIKANSDVELRTAIIQYGDAGGTIDKGLNIPFLDWLVKNRYNSVITWMSIYEDMKKAGVLEEINKRGLEMIAGHHDSSRTFLPALGNEYFDEKYYETHPEYYKLRSNGERFCMTDHWGQIVFCSRNDDMIDQVAKNVLIWLEKNPDIKTIKFPPQDGNDEDCQCEKCKEHTKIENYIYFISNLAKKVAETRPDVKFVTTLYVDLWECPKDFEIDPHVIVSQACWHVSGVRAVGNPNGDALNGSELYEKNVLKWQKAGARIMYYDYYMAVYPARNRLVPMADAVQAYAKRFKELGFYGPGTQIECFNHWNHLFNFFTFARTFYDSDLSMIDCLDKFIKIFGAGGKYIKEIIIYLEDIMGGDIPLDECGYKLMQIVDKQKVYALYEQALESAENAYFRNNIKLLRMAFRYSDLETSQIGAETQYPYEAIKNYLDIDPELLYMTKFDSFYYNQMGYGIMIPVKGTPKGEFTPNKWYKFE